MLLSLLVKEDTFFIFPKRYTVIALLFLNSKALTTHSLYMQHHPT